MKFDFKTTVVILGLLLPGIKNDAFASIDFSNQASLTFALDGAYAGLQANGSFNQEIILPGDDNGGTVTATNQDLSSLDLDQAYQFAVTGSVADGSISANHVGHYTFNFTNNSTNTYSILLSIPYVLSATTNGIDSSLSLVFSDDVDIFDEIYFSASVFGNSNVENIGTLSRSFTLSANQQKNFYVDLTSTADIYAAPVPLPAAVWSFLAGLFGILGIKKRKQESAKHA
ncbi:VPLPA-CTERM sorting domain-containing protein [Methylomonas rosea]|uniref:VPLPA-CTERM sorting domain-containing protein n=1 Tax=Methylomonas rosea TaxID=2952227 RepID=A0ABT1TR76_9GAMM|nr:VPLPA-CTERM sorting domain-containing protein [Methylomonas sp. WSC-7]MCQ8117267.1 VPLPA-CTERM sorting domain-containing protein [Methylomonas sp. WSC-7]